MVVALRRCVGELPHDLPGIFDDETPWPPTCALAYFLLVRLCD